MEQFPIPLAEYEQTPPPKKGKGRLKRVLFLAAVLVFFLTDPLGLIPQTATMEHGWELILVNDDYLVPEDYPMELVELSNGQKVDRRIYPDLQEMFDTMRSQGVYPIVASGYRTEEKQRALLEERIQKYWNQGHSHWKARKLALEWVAQPGTSEHQLGIAVDINQEGARSTAAEVYGWLEDNAHRYGFIYRYPADKVSITGVSNEPWHYRYVGKEAAAYIHEKGITLEEYLQKFE